MLLCIIGLEKELKMSVWSPSGLEKFFNDFPGFILKAFLLGLIVGVLIVGLIYCLAIGSFPIGIKWSKPAQQSTQVN